MRNTLLEVRMARSLFSGDAAGRIVLQHGFEEVDTCFFETGDKAVGVFTRPFGECGLEVGEGGDAWPGFFVGGAEEAGNFGQLTRIVEERRQTLVITYRKILKISSISESPGKRGLRVHISAKMAPTDQMSTPVEY